MSELRYDYIRGKSVLALEQVQKTSKQIINAYSAKGLMFIFSLLSIWFRDCLVRFANQDS